METTLYSEGLWQPTGWRLDFGAGPGGGGTAAYKRADRQEE